MKVSKDGITFNDYLSLLGRPCGDSLEQLHEAMNQTIGFIKEERSALRYALRIPVGYGRDPETGKLGVKWGTMEIEKIRSKRLEMLRNQQRLIRDRVRMLKVERDFSNLK